MNLGSSWYLSMEVHERLYGNLDEYLVSLHAKCLAFPSAQLVLVSSLLFFCLHSLALFHLLPTWLALPPLPVTSYLPHIPPNPE